MRLKNDLVLRKITNQYIIVATGKRVQEIPNIIHISASAAYLWDFMKDNEFTKEMLVEKVMEHYTGVTEEIATADIEKYIDLLKRNNILELEPGEKPNLFGSVHIKMSDVSQ